ncbi:MAG TPA: cobyrinate a,c-diamide synthase [Selenomonadales bacterium]|nr:cobyrinate a,c-diamide synthase [Selenomonadales bacterium]
MKEIAIPRLVIAGTGSGVGKTTIVAGLLAALSSRGLRAQSYKIGPDYIDPGYHRLASGRPAHNLDSWLVPAEKLPALFAKTAAGCDVAIIEGVMGLFDGGRGGISSTAAVAKQLGAPVLLVLDARSAGESIAATALGFKLYDPELTLAGLMVNRLGSDSHRAIVAEALARLGLPVFGYLHRDLSLGVTERHLGLTPVEESDARAAVEAMGRRLAQDADIDGILRVAESAPPLTVAESPARARPADVSVGVAQDEAFSFYYPESLAVLEENGARIVPFSPLRDKALPEVDGLIFGGGFPEMFLSALESNEEMKQAIRGAAGNGMPVYAECGGLMYLTRKIAAFDGREFAMVGLIPAVCRMESRLQTVGYVEATALADTLLGPAGSRLRGHEFHFSCCEPDEPQDFPHAFRFRKTRTGSEYPGGYSRGNLLASYLHLHFSGNADAAACFLEKCRRFGAAGRAL